jgi:hypothetical protein
MLHKMFVFSKHKRRIGIFRWNASRIEETSEEIVIVHKPANLCLH